MPRAYSQVREVGSGSFGKAILVKDESGHLFVMKTIDISRMESKERKGAVNEVRVLSSLKHPYIVSYQESFIESGMLCIIMDYAEGGDLYAKIQRARKGNQPFPEQQILRWFTQAALALKYMHDKLVLHRDLKSQNLFLTSCGRLRIGDFGIAKALESTSQFANTRIGTPYYLSPEMCREQPYSWTSDVWAMGCVLFEMCCLRVPFEASNFRVVVEKITRGPLPTLPSSYSSELRAVASEMLNRDCKKRPSIADILQKPLIQCEIRRMLKEERTKRPPRLDGARAPGANIPRPAPLPRQVLKTVTNAAGGSQMDGKLLSDDGPICDGAPSELPAQSVDIENVAPSAGAEATFVEQSIAATLAVQLPREECPARPQDPEPPVHERNYPSVA
mmetsp:Transcript_10096/g.22265  ORF Transcript_10096/g.22265 Transcript_10096/m.22265 type:complete len:390 (+) Transcript_10096:1-1170(+)